MVNHFSTKIQPRILHIYAVRRPNHAPEGGIFIETKYQDNHDTIITCTIPRITENDHVLLQISLDVGTRMRAKYD